jgi:hypothetical protein
MLCLIFSTCISHQLAVCKLDHPDKIDTCMEANGYRFNFLLKKCPVAWNFGDLYKLPECYEPVNPIEKAITGK